MSYPWIIAYSYLRYSTPEQGKGDSVRRQDALALAWCKRNHARLDPDKRMVDKGLSGSSGAHIRVGALGQFLAEIEAGGITSGSVLLIENMDRLSREKPVIAVHLLTSILVAGIRVVQLAPDEIELTEDSDLFTLFRGQLSQGRGHDEAKMKGNRSLTNWTQKKERARKDRTPVTTYVPQWLRPVPGSRPEPIPERVATVKRIFELAASGAGFKWITRQLTADGIEPWGYSGTWSKTYLRNIVRNRAVLGEYQPHRMAAARGRARKQRVPDGEPIAKYFPVVIDQATWDRAQAAIAGRLVNDRPKGGRVGKVPYLFQGLLRDAENDCSIFCMNQNRGKRGQRTKVPCLVSAAAADGHIPMVTFPYLAFEEAILGCLPEIPKAEVLGAEPEGESEQLTKQLTAKRARLKLLEAELGDDEKDLPTLVNAVKKLDHACRVLERMRDEARGREANPRGESFAEMQTLAGLAKDPQTRLRLRTLVRHNIDSIDVLVVRRKAIRLAAVQLNFASGSRRSYCIEYRSGAQGRPGRWIVQNTDELRALPDLRQAAGVAGVRRFLEAAHDRFQAASEADEQRTGVS